MEKRNTSPRVPRTILCATDLSCRCDRALDRAVSLARRWEANLLLLTVIEPGDAAVARQRYTGASRRQVAEGVLRADANVKGVAVSVRVEEGTVAETIRRVAAADACDLIVTGIARNEAFGRMVLGTTVDTLVRRSTTPILVVRSRVRGNYRRLTVPTDFLAPSQYALETALAYFPDRALSLFHAYSTSYLGMTGGDLTIEQARARADAEREAREFLDRCELSPEVRKRLRLVLSFGSPSSALNDYVDNGDSDLIVLATHGRSVLLDLLIGGEAKRILDTATADVLVVRHATGG
ncbi:MAG TPA: universal stress protein [Labilithrix sp.]|nr:universal stress protein [Labilithrix sp.]